MDNNKSLRTGVFPSRWKEANVIPIFKSGSRSLARNYRPISLLCCVAKIFEKLVYQILFGAVRESIVAEQHGFHSGR